MSRAWSASRFGTVSLYAVLLFLNIVAFSLLLGRQSQLRLFAQQVDLQQETTSLAGKIDRRIDALYQTTRNLSVNPTVIRYLTGKAVGLEDIQLVMETSRSALGVQFAYLMDSEGLVVAATKFEGMDPIMGKDFSFRPYFSQAMAGEYVIYPAVGVETNTRGLYFSGPVKNQDQNSVGVIVIKMGLSGIDQLLSDAPGRMAMTTGDGVIFATNQTGWFLKATGSVGPEKIQQIRDSRQFADASLEQLNFTLDSDQVTLQNIPHLVSSMTLAEGGTDIWKTYNLQPLNENYPLPAGEISTIRIVSGVIGFLDLIIMSLIFNIGKRRKSEAELRHNKENLEVIVDERTEQLQIANHGLKTRSEFIKSTFGRYISNEVVENVLESPEAFEGGGARRELSILMTDIRGFSALSSQLEPEQVVRLLNIYLGVMTDIILEHKGTIDEFIGDAILVLFGAPIAMEDHAAQAVQCAVQMQLAMEKVNELNLADGLPAIEMGIGINSGEVVVGNIGSEKRLKYGVVGSAVNLTSRIESYTVGGQILISENTYRLVQPHVIVSDQREVHPKGAPNPILIYEVSGFSEVHLIRRDDEKMTDLETEMHISLQRVIGKELDQHRYPGKVISWSPGQLSVRTEALLQLNDSVVIGSSSSKPGKYGKVIEVEEPQFEIKLSNPLADLMDLA